MTDLPQEPLPDGPWYDTKQDSQTDTRAGYFFESKMLWNTPIVLQCRKILVLENLPACLTV
jgi:hypothetical protein